MVRHRLDHRFLAAPLILRKAPKMGVESPRVGGAPPMSNKPQETEDADEKPSVTLLGKVEKIIPGVIPAMPDKAQIAVEGAEDLYKEIRVENTLQDENGKPVKLKPGAEVEVTIEAEKHATEPKNSSDSEPPSDKHPKK